MTDKIEDRKFKKKEIKGILKVAVKRKYNSQRQQGQQVKGLSFSELSQLAREGEIGQEDLTEAVKDYEGRRRKRKEKLVALALVAAFGTGIGYIVRAVSRYDQRVSEVVTGTVISAVTGKVYGDLCPEYNLEFRAADGNIYHAGLVCTFDRQESHTKRELIKPGSQIYTTRGALETFTRVAPPNIFSGTIDYDRIGIIKP